MRIAVLLPFVLIMTGVAHAHDVGDACATESEFAYARWRARLCDPARNAEILRQRFFANTSYLQAYGTPRLGVVPTRIIDPSLPAPRR